VSEKSKIYLVRQLGDYEESDEIHGAFLSKKEAQSVCDLFNGKPRTEFFGMFNVMEFEIDPINLEFNGHLWQRNP